MKYHISTQNHLSFALRDVRKTHGLSQDSAGKNVGLLPKTISALENRPGSVTIESFFKLLSALDLELVLSPKNEHLMPPSSNASEDW